MHSYLAVISNKLHIIYRQHFQKQQFSIFPAMPSCTFGAEMFVFHTTAWKILLSQGTPVPYHKSQTHLCFTWHLGKMYLAVHTRGKSEVNYFNRLSFGQPLFSTDFGDSNCLGSRMDHSKAEHILH